MSRHIPISGGDPTPGPPAYGGLGEAGWARGKTFLELVESEGASDASLRETYAAVDPAAADADFFAHYARRVRVLVLGDPTDFDTRINVAQAERLFALGKNIWMRIFPATDNLDLLRLFAGAQHDLPLFVFFGDDRLEFARWGPCPHELLELEAAMPAAAPPEERAAIRRAFYERDRGLALARDLRALLAAHLGV